MPFLPINIKHDAAHSAMGDVLATIEIAKLLNRKAPNVWKAALMTTNKDKSLELIKNELTFCTDFFYYGMLEHVGRKFYKTFFKKINFCPIEISFIFKF